MKNFFQTFRSTARNTTVQRPCQGDLDRAEQLLRLRPCPPVRIQRSHPVLVLVDDDGNEII